MKKLNMDYFKLDGMNGFKLRNGLHMLARVKRVNIQSFLIQTIIKCIQQSQ